MCGAKYIRLDVHQATYGRAQAPVRKVFPLDLDRCGTGWPPAHALRALELAQVRSASRPACG